MRIVTWNCNRGPANKKFAALDALEFDVAIVQEVPANRPEPFLWCGGDEKNGGLGVGVLAKAPFHAQLLPVTSDDRLYAFPIRITGPVEFNLLAVWAQKAPTYVRAMLTALDLYRDFLGDASSVVAGDFNTNSRSDKQRSAANHSHVVQKLAEAGLSSAYHWFHGLAHGEETHHTLYYLWHEDDPYHVDYCFVPHSWLEKIRQVTVGSYADWRDLSDHRPLIVDIEFM